MSFGKVQVRKMSGNFYSKLRRNPVNDDGVISERPPQKNSQLPYNSNKVYFFVAV